MVHRPVSLYATTEFVRAAPKGVGSYKLGANYATGLVPQMAAAKAGHQQILWLWGEDHEVTEVGTMNFFAVWINEEGSKCSPVYKRSLRPFERSLTARGAQRPSSSLLPLPRT